MKYYNVRELNAFKAISSESRVSSIDVFRGIAIISVVVHHFNDLFNYGNLGVDLFFVISGLLIGGILTKDYSNGAKINFFKFFVQRGLKIWPSYYSFFIFGTLIAYLFYHSIAPDQLISFWDMKRYLFFYQNYTGYPYHWTFDHVWSLCVEEHFYIFLPLSFMAIQYFFKQKKVFLFWFTILTIILGIIFKIITIHYTHSKDTHSATHCRIDALAWGVLLNLFIFYYNDKLKRMKRPYIIFLVGLILFLFAIYLDIYSNSFFYEKVIFQSLTPFCFTLMIAGIYNYNFSNLKLLRIIAYYSYNWYLWHTLFVIFITHYIGNNITGFVIYLVVSFIFAVIFTVFIEEFFLSKRNLIINKLFKH